jgi:hypothetical protein
MKSINEYSIIEKEYKTTSRIGILLFVFFIVVKLVLKIELNLYTNPIQILSLASLQLIIYVVAWVIIAFAVVRTFQIAKELGRNPLGWSIFAFIATPLALIIVSNIGEKYKDEEVRKIVNKCRKEFKVKLGVKKNLQTSNSEKEILNKKLIEKHNSILRNELVSLRTDCLIEQINLLVEQEIISTPVNIEQQRIVIANDIRNNLVDDNQSYPLCPACSAKVSSETIICSECEMTLNNAT